MLVQIISDLHLETFPSYGAYKHQLSDANYLALLGDVGHVGNPDFERLIEKLLDSYAIIFYLLGNHDTRGLAMDTAKRRVRALETRLAARTRERTVGRFIFLDQTRCDLDGRVTILGCTLYSHVPHEHSAEVEMKMIEFNETPGWTLEQHNAAHEADLAWLNSQVTQIQLDEPQRSISIFTHHSPTIDNRARDPRHKIDDPMTCAFSSDLSDEICWTSPAVRLWAWGHTHWNCNFTVERGGDPRLVCFTNQRGYFRGPKASFDSTASVDLPEGKVYRQAAAPLFEQVEERRGDDNAGRKNEGNTRGFQWARRLFRH